MERHWETETNSPQYIYSITLYDLDNHQETVETLCQSKLWAPLWTWSNGARRIAFTVWGRAICLSRGKGAWGHVNFHIESWNESDETFELSNFGSMFRGLAGSTGMYSHGTFWQSSLIELQSGQAERNNEGNIKGYHDDLLQKRLLHRLGFWNFFLAYILQCALSR